MRRILGATGAPQIIPPITNNQAPLLDFTSQGSQRALQDRTVYLDLWAYVSDPLDPPGSIAGSAYPAFWNAMLGETQLYTGECCVFLGLDNNLQDAVDLDHRIVAEAKRIPIGALNVALPPKETALGVMAPTHIVQNYPLNGPVALWLLHNYTPVSGNDQLYVWGYYRLEGDVSAEESRVFQPNIKKPVLQYIPPTVIGNGVPTTVHEVSSDLTDEVTLEMAMTGQNFTPMPAGPTSGSMGGHTISFTGAGVTLPIWQGGDFYNTPTGYNDMRTEHTAAFRTWFDGIPMRGAGKIQIARTSGQSYRSTARGSFARY